MTTPKDPNSIADALDAWDHFAKVEGVNRQCDCDLCRDLRTAARLLRESAGTADQPIMVADDRDDDGERLLFYVDESGVTVKCGYLFADAPVELEVVPAGTADRLAEVERERDEALARAEESALWSIEARNPGINMDEVRASRAAAAAREGQP